jgi:hypothetical protein
MQLFSLQSLPSLAPPLSHSLHVSGERLLTVTDGLPVVDRVRDVGMRDAMRDAPKIRRPAIFCPAQSHLMRTENRQPTRKKIGKNGVDRDQEITVATCKKGTAASCLTTIS